VEPEFWHERWRTRQIGFHQSAPHPFLERWWPSMQVPAGARVYVPLCGKSLDMIWLAVRGHAVVGTEVSSLAVQEFFGERGVSAEVEQRGAFKRHAANGYELLEGDALALTPQVLGEVHAAYDRAALVALAPDQRADYVRGFSTLLPTGSRTLLIGFEYAQALKAGPPYSVEPDEIEHLYDKHFEVRELERLNIIADSPKFRDQGVKALYEVAYMLTRR
jgi:thiopurine S-methyltransferase